jgi:sugar lactone lactonase YvrE
MRSFVGRRNDMTQVEVIANIGMALGEGPSWDESNQVLNWVDIMGQRIYSYDPMLGKTTYHQLDQMVGAVVPREAGGLTFAGHKGLYHYDPVTGQEQLIAAPEAEGEFRFNDGKCDPAGRFWAGTMSLANETGTSSLYRLDLDGTLHRMVTGVTISNGLGWNPGGTIMYYIDTPTLTVCAFDYDLERGDISNRRVIIDIERSDGWPDGMTVDEEGMLWIAHWGGAQVTRWDPHTGNKLSSIPMPAPNITSCVFGGPDRTDLYVTSASVGLSEQEKRQYPLAGSLFRVRTGTRGAATFSYKG